MAQIVAVATSTLSAGSVLPRTPAAGGPLDAIDHDGPLHCPSVLFPDADEIECSELPREMRMREFLPRRDAVGEMPQFGGFRVPKIIQKPTFPTRAPRVYTVDVIFDQLKSSDDRERANARRAFRMLNGLPATAQSDGEDVSWVRALFEPSGLGSRFFFTKYPGELFGTKLKTIETEYFVDLVFTLDSESLTHAEFVRAQKGQPELQLHIKHQQLQKALEGVIDFRRRDYHCLVLAATITSVRSTLPVSFSCSLHSKLSPASPHVIAEAEAEDERKRNPSAAVAATPSFPKYASWSRPSFVSANGVAGYTCYPNQQVMKIFQPLYIADEHILNSPDATRYLSLDFAELRKALNTVLDNPLSYPVYRFILPDQKVMEFPLPLWFYFEHFALIEQQTKSETLVPQDVRLNKMLTDATNTEQPYVQVSKEAYDKVLRRRMTAYDKDQLLMNLDDVFLSVRPAAGAKGWEDYEQILMKQTKMGGASSPQGSISPFAQFSVTVQLAFEPYLLRRDGKTATAAIQRPYIQQHLAPPSSAAVGDMMSLPGQMHLHHQSVAAQFANLQQGLPLDAMYSSGLGSYGAGPFGAGRPFGFG